MKQATILVTEKDDERMLDYAHSGLCFIRDWNLGWFEVPLSMKEKFEKRFNTSLSNTMEYSICPADVTEADIDRINRNNWQSVFWKNDSVKESIKKYIAEVKGWSYDNLFIRLKDNSDKLIGGASSWRQFEDLAQKLKEEAKKNGYSDVEISMSFVV